MENIVAIHLFKKYGNELYYYNKNVETGFYVPSAKLLVQVSYSLANEDTKKREVNSLIKTADFLSGDRLTIVTKSEEYTLEYSGRKIEVVPLWKFLMNEENA